MVNKLFLHFIAFFSHVTGKFAVNLKVLSYVTILVLQFGGFFTPANCLLSPLKNYEPERPQYEPSLIAHNIVEFKMTSQKLDLLLLDAKMNLVQFIGLPSVVLDFNKKGTLFEVKSKQVNTVSIGGPKVLELKMAPSSPLMNLTLSGLDIELEIEDTGLEILWGFFGIQVSRLTISNFTLQVQLLADYNITQAHFSIDDFSLEMSPDWIQTIINDSWHDFVLEEVNSFLNDNIKDISQLVVNQFETELGKNPSIINLRIVIGPLELIFGLADMPIIDTQAQVITLSCVDISNFYFPEKYPDGPAPTMAAIPFLESTSKNSTFNS